MKAARKTRAPRPRPKPCRRPPAVPRVARPTSNRAAIVRRMWRTADAQVRAVEARLKADDQAPDERERDARVLSVLSRTLRELTALDAAQAATKKSKPDDDADGAPFDLDELRRALQSRLAGLRDGDAGQDDCGASA